MAGKTLAAKSAQVRLLAGSPASLPSDVVVVDPGDALLAGVDGLRLLVHALAARSPDVIRETANLRQPEWNALFPGTFSDAPPLAVLAATCSERRLHAESEQILRVITAVGAVLIAAAGAGLNELTVVFRQVARLDFPTLRAIPHLVERIRLSGAPVQLVLAEFQLDEQVCSGEEFGGAERLAMRRRLLDALAQRLGSTPEPGRTRAERSAPPPLPATQERDALNRMSTAATAEDAVAAAIGVMRGSFFSTNHDTGVLAAHRLLAELERTPELDIQQVRAAVDELDLGDDPGSIGVDAAAVTDPEALFSLAHRYLGMVAVFTLDYRTALAHLGIAADSGSGVVRARARLLRALLLIKRMDDVPAGFTEVAAGLAGLDETGSDVEAVEAAWLHNVKALGHVQLKTLDQAMTEERSAIRLIGKLSTTDATHLKVNLVSNVSVLKEYSRRPDAALRVWRQFSQRSTRWGDTFFKHHAYREGGLLVRADAVAEALPVLAESYRLATAAGDDFYSAHIALERGRLLLDSRPEAAVDHFELARGHTAAIGDPFLTALAVAGAGLAAGRLDRARRQEAMALAQASLSYPRQRAALLAALADGADEDVLACLPRPGTKLNRPFLTVRLDLPELR